MKTIVTGVIGMDAHIVGNRILQRVLEKEGFKVIPLGALTPADEFIKAAVETNADAIVISSLYGHAEIDCQDFGNKCIEAGLQDILLYIGGNLSVGTSEFKITKKIFNDMGFKRVYPPEIKLEDFISDMRHDLGIDSES
jgi:methylaspartate mutase sigma subunit